MNVTVFHYFLSSFERTRLPAYCLKPTPCNCSVGKSVFQPFICSGILSAAFPFCPVQGKTHEQRNAACNCRHPFKISSLSFFCICRVPEITFEEHKSAKCSFYILQICMFSLRHSSVNGGRGKYKCLGAGNSGGLIFFSFFGGSQGLHLCVSPLKHLPITAVGTATSAGSHQNTTSDFQGITRS